MSTVDSASVFTWVCDTTSGSVRIISTGLASGKGLADLISFTSGGWKQMTVTVNVSNADGTGAATTAASAWAGNSVVVDNDGLTAGQAVAGTIYIVTTNSNASYLLDANRAAVVVKPGATLTAASGGSGAVSGNSANHLWIEGALDGNAQGFDGVWFSAVNFSVLHNVLITNPYNGTNGRLARGPGGRDRASQPSPRSTPPP